MVRQAHVRFVARGVLQRRVNIMRYKHTLKTVMYVFLVFLLCYLPYICCTLALRISMRSEALQVAVHFSVTIAFINSALNPGLYYWRIPEIRRAVKQVLRLGNRRVEKNAFVLRRESGAIEAVI